jgi:hypothetical protein
MMTQASKRKPLLVRSQTGFYLSLCVHSPLAQDDDAIPSARISRKKRRMDEQARTDTSSRHTGTHGSPSAKVWGLYLSQAEKVTKDQSESWTANTDGVLVFVRRSLSVIVGIVLKAML